jgi:hypothetical protein
MALKRRLMMRRAYGRGALGALLLSSTLFVGCGGGGGSSDNSILEDMSEIERVDNNEKGSNIPYLRENHMTYYQHGTHNAPTPIKDPNNKTISWLISASSKEGAVELMGHVQFMENKMEAGNNPRAWDTLFLMEAYMSKNGHYERILERNGQDVVIKKIAHTACSYAVISAHSDAISGDFFARGDVSMDYSAVGHAILASSACDGERQVLQNYIIDRQKTRG